MRGRIGAMHLFKCFTCEQMTTLERKPRAKKQVTFSEPITKPAPAPTLAPAPPAPVDPQWCQHCGSWLGAPTTEQVSPAVAPVVAPAVAPVTTSLTSRPVLSSKPAARGGFRVQGGNPDW